MQLIEQATLMMFLHLHGNSFKTHTHTHTSVYIYININTHIYNLSIGSCRADIIDYGNAFNLTMYLTNETDYIVWSRVSSSIAYVRDMLSSDTVIFPKFQVRPLAFH